MMIQILSWVACLTLLYGIHLIGKKRIAGFYVAGAAEVLWIAWGCITHSFAIVAMSTMILGSYERAVMRWRRKPTSKRRAVIESPLSGHFARNQRYARLCAVDAMRRGESPYASHLFFTQMLNDATHEDRRLGMECGFAWGETAEVCLVYTDLGESSGMQEGIERARRLGITVERRILPIDLLAQLDSDVPVSLRPTQGAA